MNTATKAQMMAVIATLDNIQEADVKLTTQYQAIRCAIPLLNGYLRVLTVLAQFKIIFGTFLEQYPEVFRDV